MTTPFKAAVGYLNRLREHRDLAVHLALGKIRAANSTSLLGLVWWVLNPLLLAAVYFLVFGVIFGSGRGDPEYLAYLLSGMFAFYYTTRCITGGATSITSNARLVSNLRFPRIILPASVVLEAAIGFAASILVFFVLAWTVAGVGPGIHTFWLVPAFLIQSAFNLGLGALVARFAVYYGDMGNLLPYLLRIWLYLSPVIWTLDYIEGASPEIQQVIAWNPMFSILALYRTALVDYDLSSELLWRAVAVSLVTLAVGAGVFIKGESRLTRYL